MGIGTTIPRCEQGTRSQIIPNEYKEEEATALLPLLFCDNFEGHWGICREIRGGCRNKLEKKGRELWRSSGIGLNFAYRKQN